MPQGSTTFHEAEERLSSRTRDLHRAIVSLEEELEAIDWYQQRMDATEDRLSRCRHGQGYTMFECTSEGLEQEVLLFVPVDDPIKIIRVRIGNRSGRRRRLWSTWCSSHQPVPPTGTMACAAA